MTYLNDKVSHIAVDEAHVVLSWGKEDFRPAFSKLASLRACIPGAKVIALTASANLHSRNMIAKVLGMRNTQHIVRSPNRSNIYMCVLARPENYGEEGIDRIIDPILTKLKLQEQHFERTVIYASLKWCGYIHRRAVMHHGIIAGQLIAQYHAPQTQEMKTFICSDMSVKSGNLRLLLATEAYGMGADCSNLRHVIHIGPPNTLETYIQEIGRVGRDGLPSFSTIFYNKSDISRNKAHLHQTMKDFLLTNNCRRQTMLAHFDFENEIQTSSCCDNCKAQSLLIDSSQACKVARKRLDLVKKEKCRISLQKYFQISNSQHSDVCIPAMVTGLCDQVLETVMKGVESYGSYAKLRESFPGIKDVHLINISNIISKIVET